MGAGCYRNVTSVFQKSEFMGFELHLNDFAPEHDDSAGIAFFTRGGEIKQKSAPDPNAAGVVTLEPDASEKDGVVQQHHIHGFAVTTSSVHYKVFDGFCLPPVPSGEACCENPEEGSESQSAGGPVDGLGGMVD